MTRNTTITDTPTYKRLWRDFVRPHLGLMFVAIPLMIVVAGATSAYPLLVNFAFQLLESADKRIFTLVPATLVAVAIIKALALYGQVLLTNALALRVVRDLQNAMFLQVQKMDMARLNADAGGLLVSKFTNDVNLAKETLVRASNTLVRDLLVVIGSLGAMLYLNWKLALIILIIYPLATLPVILLGRKVRAISLAAQHQIGELTAMLTESIGGSSMVRSFGLEAHEKTRAGAGFAERYRLAMRLTATKAGVDPFLEVLGALSLATILGYAGLRAVAGGSAIPELMGFITAVATLAPAARALGTLNVVWQEGMAATGRAYEILDDKPTITSPDKAADLQVKEANIEFKTIQFSYGSDIPALNNISFTAHAGKTLALVGPSGSGKTSIFNLLLRFYDAGRGQIMIDGQDITKHTLTSLRHSISLVAQHPVLFNDTVRANIAFGNTDANDQQIKAAARNAAALTFIEDLPLGFETIVGENGNRLSGGQRQRIAIARAIIKDAPILLLDEATSALDSNAESQVQDALAKLSVGRTTLVIAHRLTTVKNADNILVMEDGKIVESGNHEALLANNGLYAVLAKKQLR
ncbi:MAG: ABC transporter ATP-binding protein [Robiginitomaculum sp.]|nr:ABC transporter ATP-binding protein [Robiginitomaculum sp.]